MRVEGGRGAGEDGGGEGEQARVEGGQARVEGRGEEGEWTHLLHAESSNFLYR